MYLRKYSKFLLVLAFALGASRVQAALVPEVRDDAAYFPPEAIQKANQMIREIHNRFGLDLLIETFKGAPEKNFKKLDRESRDKYMVNWAMRRAKEANVNGVYVLICRDGVQVLGGKAFPPSKRKELRELVSDRIAKAAAKKVEKKKANGEVLIECVSFVSKTLEENGAAKEPVVPTPPVTEKKPEPLPVPTEVADQGKPELPKEKKTSSVLPLVLGGIALLLAGWVAFGVFRSRNAPGSFLARLMAGMFGFAPTSAAPAAPTPAAAREASKPMAAEVATAVATDTSVSPPPPPRPAPSPIHPALEESGAVEIGPLVNKTILFGESEGIDNLGRSDSQELR